MAKKPKKRRGRPRREVDIKRVRRELAKQEGNLTAVAIKLGYPRQTLQDHLRREGGGA